MSRNASLTSSIRCGFTMAVTSFMDASSTPRELTPAWRRPGVCGGKASGTVDARVAPLAKGLGRFDPPLVEVPFTTDAHADALVEARGTGLVAGIDVQACRVAPP